MHGEKTALGIFAHFSSALIFLGVESGAEVNREVIDSKSHKDTKGRREGGNAPRLRRYIKMDVYRKVKQNTLPGF